MMKIIIIIMRHTDICNREMNLNLNLFHTNKLLMRTIAIVKQPIRNAIHVELQQNRLFLHWEHTIHILIERCTLSQLHVAHSIKTYNGRCIAPYLLLLSSNIGYACTFALFLSVVLVNFM